MFTFFGLFRRATPAAPPPAASPVEAAQKPWWQQPQLDQPLPDSAHRRQQQRRQREGHHSDDEFEDACDVDGKAPSGSRLHGQQQQGTAAAVTDVPMRSRRKAALKRPMRRAAANPVNRQETGIPARRGGPAAEVEVIVVSSGSASDDGEDEYQPQDEEEEEEEDEEVEEVVRKGGRGKRRQAQGAGRKGGPKRRKVQQGTEAKAAAAPQGARGKRLLRQGTGHGSGTPSPRPREQAAQTRRQSGASPLSPHVASGGSGRGSGRHDREAAKPRPKRTPGIMQGFDNVNLGRYPDNFREADGAFFTAAALRSDAFVTLTVHISSARAQALLGRESATLRLPRAATLAQLKRMLCRQMDWRVWPHMLRIYMAGAVPRTARELSDTDLDGEPATLKTHGLVDGTKLDAYIALPERQLPAGLPSPLPAQDEEQDGQGEGGDQDEEGGRGSGLGSAGQRIRAQVAVTRASERKRCRDAFEFPPSDADGEGAGKGDQDGRDGAGDVGVEGCVTLGDSSSGSEGSRGYVLKGKVATAAALAARPATRGTPHVTPKTRSGASPSPGARGRRVSSGGQGSGQKRRKWCQSRKRKFWSLAETLALLQGMKVHGRRWQVIYDSRVEGSFLTSRQPGDLRPRWDNLEKQHRRGWEEQGLRHNGALPQYVRDMVKALAEGREQQEWPQIPESAWEQTH